MKVGIIGERLNFISYAMLSNSLKCDGVEVVWFADSRVSSKKREKLYGKNFDYGFLENALNALAKLKHKLTGFHYNCRKLCESHGIRYVIPDRCSLNSGLPREMYESPEVDYALIAACDQILNENGLKIARKKILNYHYSPLPSYRGKYILFWQWYNGEPFIGYTFHEVDLGVDTGSVIFQGKVDYGEDEPFSPIMRRVITESGENVCRLYDCLRTGRRVLLEGDFQNSFFKSKQYLDLITVSAAKSVDETIKVFDKTGFLKLRNGLTINRILSAQKGPPGKVNLSWKYITLPLQDGYIKATPATRLPFWLIRLTNGKKKLLEGLEEAAHV